MLSSIISKKRGRDEISTDSFDVYVPQKNDPYENELTSKLARMTLDQSISTESNGYKVYHYKLIDTKQINYEDEATSRIESVVTVSKQNTLQNGLSDKETNMIERIQDLITLDYSIHHKEIHDLMICLVNLGHVTMDYQFLFEDQVVTLLYIAISTYQYDDAFDFLEYHADSTFAYHNETMTPAALFMQNLRSNPMLTPTLEKILVIIRKQVEERIKHKTLHPEDTSIIVHDTDAIKDTYDVYMATTEDRVFYKPENGLLSEDLLTNQDYELEDYSHTLYYFEEDEHEDDEDSQNRSVDWEYGGDDDGYFYNSDNDTEFDDSDGYYDDYHCLQTNIRID